MPGEKTEQPTPKRIKEARKKGQVFKSNDLTQAFLFLTAAAILVTTGGSLVLQLKTLLIQFFQPDVLTGELKPDELLRRTGEAWFHGLLSAAPLMGGLCVVAVCVTFLQVRALFAPEVLKPKFDKLNPAKNFQNMFLKPRTYLNLLKNIVKFVIVTVIVYYMLKSSIADIALSVRMDLNQTAAVAGTLLSGLLLSLGGVFIILGAADFMIERRLYMKGMMMSKYEVQKEHKEDEGDPTIKHMRRQLHEEVLSQDMLSNAAHADVIVVNPTHIAVAVRYDEKTMDAPTVTAKGQLQIAQKIIEAAKKNHVPIMRNVPLAWGLYEIELGQQIPEELYDTVAEVLTWVYQLAQESAK
jgi:type III secretion YscU/HrpY family protein